MKTLGLAAGLLLAPAAFATVTINGVDVEVVDAHLHTLESPGDFNLDGKASIIRKLPSFTVPYYSAIAGLIGDPYAPVLGIADQLAWAGVDQAVLLATYTQHTVGFATNRYVEGLLWDPRNVGDSDSPLFLGMASINLDDFDDPDIRTHRLDALESYLVDPRFVGIKMAHAHQGVAFDDPVLDDLYALAAETGAPLLLHTGISPFPGTKSEAEYTNPSGLENAIERYNGLGEAGRVEFVLAHVGTADARATAAALELAVTHDNVWLELSALIQNMVYDGDGSESEVVGPQHPWIIKDILDMGLVDRTIYASDGPQRSGKVRTYLADIIVSMEEAGFSTDQMARVLSGSFYDCFTVVD